MFIDRYLFDRPVLKGAAFLDQTEPGWHTKIDRDRLDISSREDCVFGQLYGNYSNGLNKHFGNRWNPGPAELAARYGFNIPFWIPESFIHRFYTRLTETWRRHLAERVEPVIPLQAAV